MSLKVTKLKYLGSKRRIAKYILPFILNDRKEGQYYVEPFCGGCNSLDKVDGNRIGSDSNKYLIALLKEMQKGNIDFPPIDETKYKEIKNNFNDYPEWVIGYAGLLLSFGGKWFAGYARDKEGKRNYANEAQRNLRTQQKLLTGVEFYACNYWELSIPFESIIYCDPPYRNTTKYKDCFDSDKFWLWCESMVKDGHKVFVSEYTAPNNWECIWQQELKSNLDVSTTKVSTEKLFILK